MRLFTGIAISPAVTDRLAALLDEMKPKVRLQWTPPGNFHITTKFLGECPDDRLDVIRNALAAISKPLPFTIMIEALGFFPNSHSPRVLWAGVRTPPSLAQLATHTDQVLQAVGIPAEKHAYAPHLTLARIKPNSSLAAIRDVLAENQSARFGSTEAAAFHLYLSRSAPGGSIYEKLATYPFQ